jgi:hypothetical protein
LQVEGWPGCIHQRIDATELVDDLTDEGGDALRLIERDGIGERPDCLGLDVRAQRRGLLGIGTVGKRDVRPFRGELPGKRPDRYALPS